MTTAEMTTSQRIAYQNVIDSITFRGMYEVKEAELTNMHGDVFVSITVGAPGDEGTMAAALCRDYYNFFIGRRGGLFQYTDSLQRVYRKYYEIASV